MDYLADREELRFFVVEEVGDVLFGELSKRFQEERYENQWTRTIYLNNPFYPVPFGTSIKARGYSPVSWGDTANIDPDSDGLLETKEDSDVHQAKRKSRIYGKIGALIHCADDFMGRAVLPCIATQYTRRHFNLPGLRITIDSNLSYYMFDGDSGVCVGREPKILRVEIKIPNGGRLDSETANLLKGLHSLPIISKKHTTDNLVSDFRNRQHTETKARHEVSGVEFESKMDFVGHDPDMALWQIRDVFANRRGKFIISPGYQYTDQGASIRRYHGHGAKVSLKGNKMKVVQKSNKQVVGKVVRTEESKTAGLIETLDDARKLGSLPPVTGEIHRAKKVFWVDNLDTGRVYHLSLDRCAATGRPYFYQVEVEYVGTRAELEPGTESKIIGDIEEITDITLSSNSGLKTSTTTKEEWLDCVG